MEEKKREIIISMEPHEKRVAVVSNGLLEEFFVERPEQKSLVGNIYKGRVESVVNSVGAAFVEIGLERRGFLYLSDLSEPSEALKTVEDVSPSHESKKTYQATPITKGQELLVQITKEPFGTKGCRLTSHPALAGRYLVLLPRDTHLGISRRIDDDGERKRLREVINELRLSGEFGLIVRTAARGKDNKQLRRDVRFLHENWRKIKALAARVQAPSLVYEELDLVLRIIRDSFTEEVDRLVVDSKYEFRRIIKFVRMLQPEFTKRVHLHQGELPIFDEKGISEQIEQIYNNHVNLKSGAYMVIEPTEGLVVIDVNSGRFRKKYSHERTAFYINCEAAKEIPRQLRLRDLGGIVVIDFIDMEEEGHRREVARILKRGLSEDHAKTDITGISRFGLVELTRERSYRTVESLSYQECPYCKGKGRVESARTVAIKTLRELRSTLKDYPKKEVGVVVHTEVAEILLNEYLGYLRSLERQFALRLQIIPDRNTHIAQMSLT